MSVVDMASAVFHCQSVSVRERNETRGSKARCLIFGIQRESILRFVEVIGSFGRSPQTSTPVTNDLCLGREFSGNHSDTSKIAIENDCDEME